MNQILCEHKNNIYWVTLNRRENANALNSVMIENLHTILDQINQDEMARALVITGAGHVFCAGADLNWMKSASKPDNKENVKDTLRLATLLDKLNTLSVTSIAKVNGAAIGGGVGLLCCCDMVIAAQSSHFAFSELRLGLVPATILPYVVNAVGVRQARYLFLSAINIDSSLATKVGLVHRCVEDTALDTRVDELLESILCTAPRASALCKQLIIERQCLSEDQVEQTARLLAEIRTSSEALSGITAFLEKKNPPWIISKKETE